jgi:hypothetical protein
VIQYVVLPVRSYSDLGELTYGTIGRYITALAVHTSLAGTVLVYLILLGELLHEIKYILYFSRGYLTLFCALLLCPIVLFFKTVKDVQWIGFVAAVTQFVAVSVRLPFIFYSLYKLIVILCIFASRSPIYPNFHFNTTTFNATTFATGGSVFSYVCAC